MHASLPDQRRDPKMLSRMLRPAAAPFLLAAAALLVAPSCGQDMLDSECDLVVLNDSACDLHLYVDGREAFAVKAGADRTLDDVGAGRHILEVVDAHGTLVSRRSIDLATGEDYYWIVDDC